ncbi:MAG: PAS domain-containing protein [Pseudomonadota bacterium]
MLYGEPQRSLALTKSEPLPWPTGTGPASEYCAEPERLVVLASFAFDELEGDPELARLARFAARLCETPTGAISLVEAERQLFLASEGVRVNETPRSTSICAHAMHGADILEVTDTTADPRFADFTAVTSERHLRFYAGAPLISAEGAPIGALCVTDVVTRPGGLTEIQREGLLVLAEAVKRRIETHRQASRAISELTASAARVQFVLDSVPDIAWSAAAGGEFDYFNARWQDITGVPPPRSVEDWRDLIHPDDYDETRVKFETALSSAERFEDEWRLRQADGSYRWVLSRAVPSSDDPQTTRWFGTLTDIDDRYRISQERELLAGELAHRIKNVFSVITGLINLYVRSDDTLRPFGKALSENILALARAQDFALRTEQEGSEDLKVLLTGLMAPYGLPDTGAVTITGDPVKSGRGTATPLALVFHELATNSAKYGALSAVDGKVAITIDNQGETISITWSEEGGPPASPPKDAGFGSKLIDLTINHQLGGSITHDWQETGLQAVLKVPAERLGK